MDTTGNVIWSRIQRIRFGLLKPPESGAFKERSRIISGLTIIDKGKTPWQQTWLIGGKSVCILHLNFNSEVCNNVHTLFTKSDILISDLSISDEFILNFSPIL